MITTIGPWLIECDPDATRCCYAKIPWGADCDCAPCRNLDALGPAAFPANALVIFEELGIDLHKPAEVYHAARLANGLHHYAGWYHCVGQILSGSDAWQPEASSPELHRLHAEPLSDHFSIGCTSRLRLVPEAFAACSVVQIEFTAELPWVLAEQEP